MWLLSAYELRSFELNEIHIFSIISFEIEFYRNSHDGKRLIALARYANDALMLRTTIVSGGSLCGLASGPVVFGVGAQVCNFRPTHPRTRLSDRWSARVRSIQAEMNFTSVNYVAGSIQPGQVAQLSAQFVRLTVTQNRVLL